ncbi:FAD-dependent oxidoreductase [Selenomonas dianae]|uniref:FAD-dependent oxidoreductase n=1 Tax=Selenomonas dianae TaxID=135079 RepID=A0ABP3CVC0_9FIRM|nr:FAD-dependent oxidoreductase [Selenomonas dianae]WLD81589.1 FAD-dependent oxidoreductase [Selenomonas dianae]
MDKMYDAVIVGGGPAGLSAAIYLARAKCKVLVVEKEKVGGQITITADVVNYPGTGKVSGSELAAQMEEQARGFGAEFVEAEVIGLKLGQEIKELETTAGTVEALSVILATGANPRKVGFYGEKTFQGRGVAYCATCDAEFFTGMDIFVIGGGLAAVEESMFLSRYGKSVTILVRSDKFRAPQTAVDALANYPNIKVRFNTVVERVGGETMISYADFRDEVTGMVEHYMAKEGETFGVFVFAGYVPNTGLFREQITLNEQGYVITNEEKETNVKGVFAAGDVCIKTLRQVVTAVSDGAIAAVAAERHAAGLHDRLKIPAFARAEVDAKRFEQRKTSIEKAEAEGNETNFISAEIREQLTAVFDKFLTPIKIVGHYDDSDLSRELRGFMDEFADLTDKVGYDVRADADGAPGLEILRSDDVSSGITFHAVPGGHEFNSFILALYNVAGPGQELREETREKIERISAPADVKVLMSLSCTMCPDVVAAVQRIAAERSDVRAEIYDIRYFPALKEKYSIMSVPCMIVGEELYFGKKNIDEIADILGNR